MQLCPIDEQEEDRENMKVYINPPMLIKTAIIIYLFFFSGCGEGFSGLIEPVHPDNPYNNDVNNSTSPDNSVTADNELSPERGNSGLIAALNITSSSVQLIWEKASDSEIKKKT